MYEWLTYVLAIILALAVCAACVFLTNIVVEEREYKTACLELGYPDFRRVVVNLESRYWCTNAYEAIEIDLDKE